MTLYPGCSHSNRSKRGYQTIFMTTVTDFGRISPFLFDNGSCGIDFCGTPSFVIDSVIFSARSIGFALEFEGENAILGFNTISGANFSKTTYMTKILVHIFGNFGIKDLVPHVLRQFRSLAQLPSMFHGPPQTSFSALAQIEQHPH